MGVKTSPVHPDAAMLLPRLHRGGKVAHLQASNPNKTYTDKKGELKEVKDSHWFNVGDDIGIPTRFTGQHVFFCVNPGEEILRVDRHGTPCQPTKTKQRIENVSVVNCLFAEYDADDYGTKANIMDHISRLALKPSVLVDSSVNGLQCYWFLSETFVIGGDVEQCEYIKQLQYDWVDLVGGDRAAKDLARVLRLPGVPNYKAKYAPDYPVVSVRDADYSREYALDEFERLTAHLRQERLERASVKSAAPTVNISQGDTELWDVLFRKKNGESIRKLKDGDTSAHGDDHSSADMALCNQLAWVTGNDAARIDRMFRQSALMRTKWERDDYREQTIGKAISNTASTYDPNYRSSNDAWSGDGWSGDGNFDDISISVQTVGHTQTSHVNGDGKPEKKKGDPLVELKRKNYERAHKHDSLVEAKRKIYEMNHEHDDMDNDDDDDDIPTSAPQAVQDAPLPTRSQKIKDLLTGNGWNFRLNILDNAVEVNGQRLTDIDESRIITYVRDVAPTKAKISKDEVRDIINVMAYENQFHPIVEYLDGLVWDGKNHVGEISEYITDKHPHIIYSDGKKSRVFPRFFGKWLISAVAKVYERGVIGAQSPMLVLSSGQDAGKSTLVKWLASGMLGYYNASDIKPDSEDHKRLLASKWIWEVGELSSTTGRADAESLKHFLTLSDVTFRVPYGRHHIQKPALASFIGTVNRDKNQGFLADPTGNRRFLTVELKDFNQDYSEHIDPNQLWAQAVALYRQGAGWRLTEEEKAMRDKINKVNTKREPIFDLILKYFDVDPAETSWRMPAPDITEYLIAKEYRGTTKSTQMAVANALRDEGLEKDDTKRPTEWIGIKLK